MFKFKWKLLFITIAGGLFGLIFPLLLITLDLSELTMDISWGNVIWVINSQNAIAFSLYAFPSVFAGVFVLFYKNNQKQKALLEASHAVNEMAHLAGMSEIASEVIHNIGNVMTVVFAYFSAIDKVFKRSQYTVISRASEMLEEKKDLISRFEEEDPQFYKLLLFYKEFGIQVEEEYGIIKKNIDELTQRMHLVKDILKTQQSYVNAGAFMEDCNVEELLDATHKIMNEKMKKRGIRLEKKYSNTSVTSLERSKLLNIMTNLLKNAIEAVESSDEKVIKFITSESKNKIKIEIIDTGEGVSESKLKKIFSYGYSTKRTGTGLGLHSCANLIKTMGGNITVHSEGEGRGASFVLSIPVEHKG